MERRSKIKAACAIVFAVGIVFSTMMLFPGDHGSGRYSVPRLLTTRQQELTLEYVVSTYLKRTVLTPQILPVELEDMFQVEQP